MPPTLPIATPELGRRLTDVGIAYVIARLKGIAEKPGNPFGIEIKRIGEATALMARGIPSPHFNSVAGLRAGQEDAVAEFADWYRASNVRPRIIVMPGDLTADLGHALARQGFVQTDFDTVLYGAPRVMESAARGVEIKEVASDTEREDFLDALLAGWGIPEERRAGAKENMRLWRAVPAFRLYVARIDGRAAAAAKLYLHERIGYFADAATRPEFRGRGLQSALLRVRAQAAATAGAELVFSHASYGSVSHRNMERAGLRVLCTRAFWTRSD